MHSNKKLLYLATQQMLASIVDTEETPVIAYIDLDHGQLEQPQPPVSWPCCLIDIDEAKYEDFPDGFQEGKLAVTIRLGFAPHSGTNNLTAPQFKNIGLKYFDIEQLIYLKFHNQEPINPTVSILGNNNQVTEEEVDLSNIFGRFHRAMAYTEDRNSPIRVRVQKFLITEQDNSAEEQTDYVPAPSIHITPGIAE